MANHARAGVVRDTWLDVWRSIVSTYNTIDTPIDIDKRFKCKEQE